MVAKWKTQMSNYPKRTHYFSLKAYVPPMFALTSETEMLTEAYMFVLALLSSDLHVTQNKTFALNEKVRKFIT